MENLHDFSDRKGTPKIIQLIRQAQGLAPNPEEESALKKLTPHVPGIVTFADHTRALPLTTSYTTVIVFADISGFTALCEKYGAMKNAGIDQLTKTLNNYLGEIVDNIISSEGDVLKFAGDAILAVWRVNNETELNSTVDQVIKCCLNIQEVCGSWETDIGVRLTVKMGVSAGEMSVTFLGNDEFRAYVELGPAIRDVNEAENLCGAGHIVLSPYAWNLCTKSLYNHELLSDQQHARILSYWRAQSSGSEVQKDGPLWFMRKRRMGGDWGVTVTRITAAAAFSEGASKSLFTRPIPIINDANTSKSCGDETSREDCSLPSSSRRNSEPSNSTSSENGEEKNARPGRPKLVLNRLRTVVKKVKDMRLDESLRLYILHPVLKKLDDNQPLEYLSEMRNVTVVFMNLVLDENVNINKLLQRVFEVVYSQSKMMHGCLNKVFFFDKGCTFLVIFGLPGFKHENDCSHALICSHNMKSILDRLAGVHSVSIGVTTGGTFCGVVGHKHRHEYSVISRKVNMAARLMMHYPNKVTCGERTFQLSRLPSSNFQVLGTKRMKGLQNVGVIREYVETSDSTTQAVAKIPCFLFPILGREDEIELIELELQRLVSGREEECLDHYIISGASGIGKTRLMDHFIRLAEQKNINVISCALRLQHLHIANCLSNYVTHVMLSSSGFSDRIDKEPDLIGALSSCGLESKLYLLNDILGSKKYLRCLDKESSEDDLRRILTIIIEKCAEKQPVLVLVDDAQNMDHASWKFLCELRKMKGVLIVLSSRPAAVEKPSCEHAEEFMISSSVRVKDLVVLDTQHIPALACQIMDVVKIPCELEVMLRERSQGVPYWCEQLLIDMKEKNQLIITYDDGTAAMKEGLITPNVKQLKKVFSENSFDSVLDENDNDQKEYSRASSVFKINDDEVMKINETKQDMMLDGNMPKRDKERKVKIALFSPLVIPKEIEVPHIMHELIITRLDSMRASEQLIVKCAAVLGQTFPRDMIEYILPKVQRVKARKSFKRLKQMGIFECANIPTGRTALLFQTNGLHPEACFCPKMEDDCNKDLCNVMRFKNNLLQQIAYNILMESQRLDLHNKTVEYLENQASEIRKRIPYYLLYRKPNESLEKKQVKRASVISRRSNKVSDGNLEDDEFEKSSKLKRRGAIRISRSDLDPLITAVCQLDGGQQQVDEFLRRLIPIYTNMERHMRLAKDSRYIVDVLLEHALAVILLKDTVKCTEILQSVDELLQSIDDKEFTLDVFRLTRISRIRGKLAYYSGDLEAAQRWFRHAGELLGIHQPSTNPLIWLSTIRCMIHLRTLRNFTVGRRRATNKTLEQGYCLSDLLWFYRETGRQNLVHLSILQQMIKVTGRTCCLHQVVESYAAAIKICKIESTKRKLETQLFESCASRHDELSHNDLVMLANVYTDMAINYLNAGDLSGAISSGTGAYEIYDKLNHRDTESSVSPILASCLLLTRRNDQFSEFLQKLQFPPLCSSDGRIQRAWYYTFCMERILNGDYPLQSFQCCLDFATNYLRSCDAVCNENVPRLFLAMTIAVWFCRKGQWDSAQAWLDYSEVINSNFVSFLSLYALSRKLEAMLLYLNTSRVTKSQKALDTLKEQIEMDLKRLDKGCRKVPSMLPRLHHLKGYLCILNQSYCKTKWHLMTAVKIATKHGNQLEIAWIKRHRWVWFKRMDIPDQWPASTSQEDTKSHASCTKESPIYTWPIVPQTNNKEQPCLQYSKTTLRQK